MICANRLRWTPLARGIRWPRLDASLAKHHRAAIDEACREFMRDVHDRALASSESKFDAPRRHIFGNRRHAQQHVGSGSKEVVRASLNRTLSELLTEHPDVLLIGEDLHDPYGGAFKVTAGLSSKFKERVISTPISEAAIAGAAIGLASAGYRPIVEINVRGFLHFGDGSDLQSCGQVLRACSIIRRFRWWCARPAEDGAATGPHTASRWRT